MRNLHDPILLQDFHICMSVPLNFIFSATFS